MTRVGIIGTGWGARVQVPAFREAGLDVTSIAGFDAAKTRRIAGELGLRPFEEWTDLIRSDVELVTIVTPPSEHRAMAAAVLERGKHVINEKPTALNAVEAKELLDIARSRPDQIAIVDHELRFLSAWRAARERVSELGPLRYIEARYSSPARGDRRRPWNWWADAQRGGGVWGAVGSHFVDAVRYLGFEIEKVQALLHSFITQRPYGTETRDVTSDDFASVVLRLRGGGLATLQLSAVAGGADEPSVLTAHFEEGAMRLTREELLLARPGQSYERVAGNDFQERPGNSFGGAFGSGTVELGRALRRALDEGDRSALTPAATFEDGLAQQLVLDAARRSAKRDGAWEAV